MNTPKSNEEIAVQALQTVYDPEFPVVDIYTLGLIYDIKIKEEEKTIYILLTLTSPACPAWDKIVADIKAALKLELPDYYTDTELTFDPMWTPDMIKDDDLKRMFDL